MTIEKNRKSLHIVVQKNNDRDEIAKKLKRYSYFLCATEAIKNMVVQEAAKMEKPAILIATDEEFQKEGKFEKVSFERV